MHYWSFLSERRLIAITGADRFSLLQGLFTCDMKRLQANEAAYGALLSPQGKFLHDFFLLPRGDALWLDIAAERLSDMVKRLTLYRLRADVQFAALSEEICVAAYWDEAPALAPDTLYCIRDPRLPVLGYRCYGQQAALRAWYGQHGAVETDMTAYEAMRIALGVPDGAQDMHIDKSLLLEYGIDALHGVDFHKGCYVGQEVTARSKFRAQLKKQLYQVDADHALPPLGTAVTYQGQAVGELRSVHGNVGLAILSVEAVEQTKISPMPLLAQSIALSVKRPDWIVADA